MKRTRGRWKDVTHDLPFKRVDDDNDVEELNDAAVLVRLEGWAHGDDSVENESDVLGPARGIMDGGLAGAILWALLLVAFTIL
jgi:hypothetical protein